jgi:hypothetical protein
MLNVGLSRYEAAELAEIERHLDAVYPGLNAVLQFADKAPDEARAVELNRIARWQRWEWTVSWLAGLVATGLLALLMILVGHEPGHCSMDVGAPAATPVAPAAAAACTSAQWREQGVAIDPRNGTPARLHHSS